MQVCSQKTCTRLTEGKFKLCQPCRDIRRKSKRKRLEIVAKATARDGYRYCKCCSQEYPLAHFKSLHSRRTTLTTLCATCRVINSKSDKKESTKKGQCRQVWFDWKKKSCELCGYTGGAIEADHIHRGGKKRKTHICSDYPWWSCHGGPEALKKELSPSIVRPLCMFCHRLVSQQDRGIGKHPTVLKKRAYVNKIKLKIGECTLCKCKVKGEKECCAFDFDHTDTELKRDAISKMVNGYPLKRFFECIDVEVAKCRLICCLCHHLHTREQEREKTFKIAQLKI
jgi:hypothetical protein